MKISEKLDYLDAVELEGEAVLAELFAALARKEYQDEAQVFSQPEEQVEMRTTSLRIEAPRLAAFDAVARRFELSRNEAIAYAIESFISDAINGYSLGAAESKPNPNNLNKAQRFSDERDSLISKLDCDADIQADIKDISHNDAIAKMKELI